MALPIPKNSRAPAIPPRPRQIRRVAGRRPPFGRLAVAALVMLLVAATQTPREPGPMVISPAVRSGSARLLPVTFRPIAFVPPSCAHAPDSQFDVIGQRGMVITRAVQRRDRPGDRAGIAIAPGHTFTVVGRSVCAVPESYSAELLFLHVHVDATGDVGWINEGVRSADGRVAYNVIPVPEASEEE